MRDIAHRGSHVAINGSFASGRHTVKNDPQRIGKVAPSDNFKKYIQDLVDYCDSNKIVLLRTIGVMFSDEEKRISEYIK